MDNSEHDTPTLVQAAEMAERLGIDWDEVAFDVDQFRAGLHVELRRLQEADPEARIETEDLIACGRIVLDRLQELPDFYRSEAPWGPDGEVREPY